MKKKTVHTTNLSDTERTSLENRIIYCIKFLKTEDLQKLLNTLLEEINDEAKITTK